MHLLLARCQWARGRFRADMGVWEWLSEMLGADSEQLERFMFQTWLTLYLGKALLLGKDAFLLMIWDLIELSSKGILSNWFS
ncbi:hypothetical protein RHMOL_Rhmol12G0250400 [Rhododendron molle]|uniref:Uncharacterized protein n=1 Tax=Rhododendron molle TaxID=49168 RepID=A0ACC0LNM9_RHOML|nr:hypothetical protein RHMOL_Rhmol12G0250400 [Rhododendron molle]